MTRFPSSVKNQSAGSFSASGQWIPMTSSSSHSPGIIPFSLAEFLLLLLLPIIIFIVVFVIIQSRKENFRLISRFFAGAFAVISVFYSLFVFSFLYMLMIS